ncbi:adenosine 5'-monophosphoramidase HINT3 [Rhinoderma darwinii]|uniref:adenosine 5'-monophosphoramidase HINT3 n=1 Tax=Rhinoderma darwinii TaxID=43563 RepID=UPI003F680820
MSAEGEEQGTGSYDTKCIFCKISNNQEGDCELLYSDEELVCFKDIRPGAPHHYLVVPKKHVGNCKTLTTDDVQLVQKMVEVAKNMLQRNSVTSLEDIRLGFHWPPFCSISHLHLHVLAPASQLGFLSRMIYRLNSYWFITADQLIVRLQANVPAS